MIIASTRPPAAACGYTAPAIVTLDRRAQSAQVRYRLEREMRRVCDRSNAIQSANIAARLIRASNDFARQETTKIRSAALLRERIMRRHSATTAEEYRVAVAKRRVANAKRIDSRQTEVNAAMRASESVRVETIAVRERESMLSALRSARTAAQSEWRRVRDRRLHDRERHSNMIRKRQTAMIATNAANTIHKILQHNNTAAHGQSMGVAAAAVAPHSNAHAVAEDRQRRTLTPKHIAIGVCG